MRFLWTLVAACVLLAGAAAAHPLPGSAVLLDFQRNAIAAELQLPLDQLELSFKQPLMQNPLVAQQLHIPLQEYLLRHLHPVAPDGRPWSVTVTGMRVTPATGNAPIELNVHLQMTPPNGAPVRRLVFNYDVMTHELMAHSALVYARSDWDGAVFASHPELLGTIRWTTKSVDIDRAGGSFWRGMHSVVALGIEHIIDGTDHLFFILTLLLPAPLLVRGTRWAEYGGASYTLKRLAKVVTAFTAGHSLTLMVGVAGGVTLAQQPVECLIATSILVSAVHAWRPLFAGKEMLVAASFGLVHGLAFAGAIAPVGMDGWHQAATIVGFNLGIEVVQMGLVLAVAPWLMLLARADRYRQIRLSAAALTGLCALGWLAERLSGQPNPVTQVVAAATPYFPLLIVMLASISLSTLRSARLARPHRTQSGQARAGRPLGE